VIAAPLELGRITVWPPVVLAPMAGITNPPFRRLCREHGAGLYVCEMITTRALLERNDKTMRMVRFDDDESPRSVQLYGVDPDTVERAVEMVVEEDLADHIDLNFGCPVPKVTRKGGGAALPYRRKLFERIVIRAVKAAQHVPVTVKMRKGIDPAHLTFLDAGRAAEQAGVKAIALHGRTAADMYSGQADWQSIADLKAAVAIPVLGNGDIWEASDALRMMAETGCDGVVVGRGCLGRPWLFGDLAAAFEGRGDRDLPTLKEVARAMHRHAELLTQWLGGDHGVVDFRKHVAWYLKGFSVPSHTRLGLAHAASLGELQDLLSTMDLDQPYPEQILGAPRGRSTGPRRPSLPDGWLDSPEDDAVPEGAELGDSGG
jgi:nifR3 family TIM-barrel protein